jgi:hypothetical protein
VVAPNEAVGHGIEEGDEFFVAEGKGEDVGTGEEVAKGVVLDNGRTCA